MNSTNANEGLTPVFLTALETKSFRLWRQNQETFETLLNAGIFRIRGACVEICFNMDGVMTTIRGEIYRRKIVKELSK